MDAEWYRAPATAEGWVVLGADATVKPRIDSTQWRLGMLAAALEAIRKEWPQSSKWPVALAGFSGAFEQLKICSCFDSIYPNMTARRVRENRCYPFLF